MAQKPLLICVVGPTAIGKTALSIALAQEFSTEIISADSRQFYKEMTIGTAVPTCEELNAVPHHFIQSKSIFDTYSVGNFEQEALGLMERKFFKEHLKTLVMVGGSGLYVDAVVKGLDSFPQIDPQIRQELNRQWQEQGIESLQKKLEKADPNYFQIIDRNNPHRLIRALEVFESSGLPYSSFLKNSPEKRNFRSLLIGLTAERETIYSRINERVDLMVKAGLFEEAESLFPSRKQNALQTVGYREIFDYLEGKISQEEAISEIKKNTRRFAKRQLTWFRKNNDIKWFDYQSPTSRVLDYIHEKNA